MNITDILQDAYELEEIISLREKFGPVCTNNDSTTNYSIHATSAVSLCPEKSEER